MKSPPLAAVILAIFGLFGLGWMPADNWGPVPDRVMVEAGSILDSLDQAARAHDPDAFMLRYAPEAALRLEDPDGKLIRTLSPDMIRAGVDAPAGVDRKAIRHLKEQKADYRFQAGPNPRQFAIRFERYLFRGDGTRDPLPSTEITCVFQRTNGRLFIAQQIVRNLRVNFDPRHPPATELAIDAPSRPAPRREIRTGPSVSTPAFKRIEDDASGFSFRVRADGLVEKILMTAGTGGTRYRCELPAEGLSIVFDLFPAPGGRAGISRQQVRDFLALKPANVRWANGEAELGTQVIAGQSFDVRQYSDVSLNPALPARAYRWIGPQHVLMVSFKCRRVEDLDLVCGNFIRGIHFPAN